MNIRPAELKDVPQLICLLKELFAIEADFAADPVKQERGLHRLLAARESAVLFVAEADGEVVGMCSVQEVISTSEGGPVGLVEDLIVKSDCRGKGTGRLLLSAVVDWCRSRNLLRVQLLRDRDNLRALSFYKSEGWSETNLVCMRFYPQPI